MKIRSFQSNDTASVVVLWEACNLTRPWNNPELDIARKCSVDDGLFLVGVKFAMNLTQNPIKIATQRSTARLLQRSWAATTDIEDGSTILLYIQTSNAKDLGSR